MMGTIHPSTLLSNTVVVGGVVSDQIRHLFCFKKVLVLLQINTVCLLGFFFYFRLSRVDQRIFSSIFFTSVVQVKFG